jgi:hypothetical protein
MNITQRTTFIFAGLGLFWSGLAVRAQGLLVTEVMTDNSKTLFDEDKDSSDWVEIFNSGDTEVSLDGYYLTDDSDELTLWRFPDVQLPAKKFLVVFCSGNDYRDPARPLHTSFRLASEGGELLLVAPDGNTIITRYGGYPEQLADTSYGMFFDSVNDSIVKAGTAVRVFVPTDGSLALQWTGVDFVDTAWRQGTSAVGFGVRSPELELLGTDVMADLQNINSSIYIRIPFDVTDPTVLDSLTLRMKYDDGFIAYINGVQVAAGNAPAEVVWNAAATKSHTPRDYESFDASAAISSLRAGKNVLAIQAMNSSANNTDLFCLPELDSVDIRQIQKDTLLFFPTPTPGGPNGQGFAQAGPRPLFSLPSGTYLEARTIELATDLAGGAIRYTTDGTFPDAESTLYSEPISVAGAVQITARVFKDGYAPGIPERNTYLIVDPALADFSSNVPIVICATFGKQIPGVCDTPYTPGHIWIIEPGEDGKATFAGTPTLTSGSSFRRRGSSTCGYDKFAFNIEIDDAEGRPKDVDIFDFPTESDYVAFGGNNFDRSLMRNPIAYWMSRECGRWAARTRFVEVFMHPGRNAISEAQYFGIYAFMEKNKRHPQKVDIQRMLSRDTTEPGVTGGHLLRRDRSSSGEISITGGGYGSLVYVYPKLPVREQQTYMGQFIGRVVNSLNPNIGKQEDNDLIDFTAWIDHHILCWYPKNVDAFRLSGYFFKDRNGPLVMGPVWDYDRTMGNADDDRAADPLGWNNNQSGDGGTRYFEAGGLGSWYSFLFANQPPLPTRNTPWNNAYKARWRELRKGPLRTDRILGQLDTWYEELKDLADRNYKRWPSQRPTHANFQGEIDHLKDWLAKRADWIDSQFIETPKADPKGGLVERGINVTLTIDVEAMIYFTLDGSDPRGTNGQPSPSATLYTTPITIQANTRLSARARFPDGVWSSLVEEKYVVEIPKLAMTEIMYNPPVPTAEEDPAGEFTASRMEFVELTNFGTEPIDLSAVSFTKGVTFNFRASPVQSIAPGQTIVIPRDSRAFGARYGTNNGIVLAGDFTGSLTDGGESVAMKGGFDEIIFDFRFDGDWYPGANGGGYSIVNNDPSGPSDTLEEPTRWALSSALLGNPGRVDGSSSGGRVLPGDTNRDGKLHVTDSVRTILMLFGGLADGPCGAGGLDTAANRQVLDWDGSEVVDVADVVRGLQYLFQGGPPHAKGVACIPVPGCVEACAP